MSEFVNIPTQRLKARQFVHPDDEKGGPIYNFYLLVVKLVNYYNNRQKWS